MRLLRYGENLYDDASVQTPSSGYEREPDIIISEVEYAVNKLKTGKAQHVDGLSAETLKFPNEDGIHI